MKKKSVAVMIITITLLMTISSKTEAAKKVYTTIEAVQQMIATAIAPVNTSLNGLSNRVTNLETTISPVPSQIASLQNKQNQMDTRLTTVETVFTPLPGQVHQLQQQNSNLTSQVSDLSEKVGTLEAKIVQLEQGTSPKEITLFPFGNIQVGQISQPVNAEGYKILTLTGKWELGAGGFHVYFSDDQTNWTEQAEMSQTSNFPPRQITIPVKGKYYRAEFTGGAPFTGSLLGLLY
jgi:uncharacterized phage infection (PIP) family protein YhgE